QPRVGQSQVARIADIDSGQTPDSKRKMIIRVRPIYQPPACSGAISRRVSPSPVILREIGIFEANKVELGVAHGDRRLLGIWRLIPPSLSHSDYRDQDQHCQPRAEMQQTPSHEFLSI